MLSQTCPLVYGDEFAVSGFQNSTFSPVPTAVTFANTAGVATMTLANGGNWEALGYLVGQGIFVGAGSDPNGNGAPAITMNRMTVANRLDRLAVACPAIRRGTI